jgi:hypothetical protein
MPILATISSFHSSEHHLYPVIRVFGRACYPHRASLDCMAKGPPLISLTRCLHLGSPCSHAPLEPLAHD